MRNAKINEANFGNDEGRVFTKLLLSRPPQNQDRSRLGRKSLVLGKHKLGFLYRSFFRDVREDEH